MSLVISCCREWWWGKAAAFMLGFWGVPDASDWPLVIQEAAGLDELSFIQFRRSPLMFLFTVPLLESVSWNLYCVCRSFFPPSFFKSCPQSPQPNLRLRVRGAEKNEIEELQGEGKKFPQINFLLCMNGSAFCSGYQKHRIQPSVSQLSRSLLCAFLCPLTCTEIRRAFSCRSQLAVCCSAARFQAGWVENQKS